jgi:TolB protein
VRVYISRRFLPVLSWMGSVILALGVSGTPGMAASPAGGKLMVNVDNPSFRKLVVALPRFQVAPGSDDELKNMAQEGPGELGRLLSYSGFFNVMSEAAYPVAVTKSLATLGGTGVEGVDMTQWRSLGVESLTIGELSRDGSDITVALRTVDIHQSKLLLGKKYSKVTRAQFKKVMAKYADRLLEAYTGKKGIFSSKMVFVGRPAKGTSKQIYLSEFDGSNAVAITSGSAPHLSPAWSRDGSHITYTSYEDGNPDLFIYEVATGKKRKLSGRKGLNSGGNWGPGDKLVAFTGSVEGDADIYLVNPNGEKVRPLIRGPGLDVDPTFSPDGKWMAFVSGRYGNPHIFRAELKWEGDSEARVVSDKRLTYAGWYNATPAWTPESDKIVFAGYDKDIDRFDMFMMNPDGTDLERLTIRAGDNERPSFSPNGQMIVFQSNRTQGRDIKSVSQLYVMNRDGSNQRPLKTGLYEAQTPSWGPQVEE